VVEGQVEVGGQEHIYLEKQSALAVPVENGGLHLYSATQAPTAVQRAVANVLSLSMNQVEVDVLRLGGAFGGKEEQGTPWACLAALAAHKTGHPVRLILTWHEDISITGKRHPYSADYRLGLSSDGQIQAYEMDFFQNAGATCDLSPSILERSLLHCTNAYNIPNVRVTAASCQTNLPPNTAFRGFGAPQGIFVIEAAIRKAAAVMGIDASEIQDKSLMISGDSFPYGMKLKGDNLRRSFDRAASKYGLADLKKAADKFNAENIYEKKGVAVTPICFGIAFTAQFLNQSSATVHIYTDGSVGVSTAGVEMGQGLNSKMREVASRVLSINKDRIRVETTNTTRIANTSPTAASTGTDLNGQATRLACESILKRLKNFTARKLETEPGAVVITESLSAHAHYATPDLHFDRTTETGNPFAYHVTGTAITETTLDVIRGTYTIDSLRIIHDVGKSLSEEIDLGQVEGAAVQGIGWVTVEELRYAEDGRLATSDLATYKIPDIYDVPTEIEVEFLEAEPNTYAPFDSKAVGEPPLIYGLGAYFSLWEAIRAARPNVKADLLQAPMTPERVLNFLHPFDNKPQNPCLHNEDK
jgi:xanthine dehydrogenase large subunit